MRGAVLAATVLGLGAVTRTPTKTRLSIVAATLAVVALGLSLSRPGASAAGQSRVATVGTMAGCTGWGRPAVAADPRPKALRVFAIQFEQRPAQIRTAGDYAHAINCAIRTEVLAHLARGRPNLVVFDEDIGLETIAVGPRGARARALLRAGVPSCKGLPFPCQTLATLSAIDTGYEPALTYLERRFPALGGCSAAALLPQRTRSCACS